jgi:hypothetical protein
MLGLLLTCSIRELWRVLAAVKIDCHDGNPLNVVQTEVTDIGLIFVFSFLDHSVLRRKQ